jgi:hypothetical protein
MIEAAQELYGPTSREAHCRAARVCGDQCGADVDDTRRMRQDVG